MDDLVEAFFDLRRDRNDLELWKASLKDLHVFFRLRQVHFIGNNARRLGCERGVVETEFLAERLVVVNRVPTLATCHVEDEEERFATNDMTQKLVPKTAILVSAFDQTGDISHGHAPVFGELDDAYERVQGCEWIGRRLGLGGGELAKERGLSSIRIPHQPDIGNRPQLK